MRRLAKMQENEDRENHHQVIKHHNLNFAFSHFKHVLYAHDETLE